MKYLVKIRQFIAEILLKRHISKQIRLKGTFNFELAKKIGVIFNADKKSDFIISKKFIDSLIKQNIVVKSIAYINSKKLPEHLKNEPNIVFFENKDFNFFYKAKKNEIKEFINSDFDILIDLCVEDYYVVNNIVRLSLSKFKVGKFNKNNYYDFMINIDRNNNLEFFINQIIQYVSKIKI